MKVRFGESSLHHCDVMLRDIKESDRLNRVIQDVNQNAHRNFADMEAHLSSLLPIDKLQIRIVTKRFWQ
jgi:anaphase-promoting complex subunit 2